jgi:hypothetical protein
MRLSPNVRAQPVALREAINDGAFVEQRRRQRVRDRFADAAAACAKFT